MNDDKGIKIVEGQTVTGVVSSWIRFLGGSIGALLLLAWVFPPLAEEVDRNRSMAFAYSHQAAADAAMPLTLRDDEEYKGLADIPEFPARPSGDVANIVVADQTLSSYYDNEASDGEGILILSVTGGATAAAVGFVGLAGVISGRELTRRRRRQQLAKSEPVNKSRG